MRNTPRSVPAGRNLIPRRSAWLLLATVLIVGVLLRYPDSYYFAEHGADGSYYAALGNVVYKYGYIPWGIHPLAFIGLYPYSEGAVAPTFLASIMATSGLPIDAAVIVASTLLALLGALGVYLCIYRATGSELASLAGSFAILTAPILLYQSHQILTTRFVAVTWAPFLLLVAMERKKWGAMPAGVVCGVIVFLLVGSHLTFALILFVFFGVFIILGIDKVWRTLRPTILRHDITRTLSRNYASGWLLVIGLAVLSTGYVATLAGLEPLGTEAYEVGVFPNSNILGYYGNLIASTAGGAGLASLGFTILAPKQAGLAHRNRTLPIIAGLFLVTTLIGFRLYIRPFIAVVFSISGGLGLLALSKSEILTRRRAVRKVCAFGIAGIILVSTVFSLILQNRWDSAEHYSMTGPSYSAFTYVKQNTKGNLYCNHYLSDRFLTAYTARFCVPDLPGSGLEMSPFVTGTFSWSQLVLRPKSPSALFAQVSTIEFYDVVDYNPYANYYSVSNSDPFADRAPTAKYGITYALEYRPVAGTYETRWNEGAPASSRFLMSLHTSGYLIFQSDTYSVWLA